MALHALLAVGLVPAFLIDGASHWDHPFLIVMLVILAVLAEPAQAKLRSGIRLDAVMAVGVVALVFGGPIPAFLVLFAPVVIASLVLWRVPGLGVAREPLWRLGNLSNVASYGWATVIGAGVLELGGVHAASLTALPVIALAGVATSTVQLTLGPCIHETLCNCESLRRILRDALIAAPADVGMSILGATTAVLMAPLGIGALAMCAAMSALPAAVPAVVHARAASSLARDVATELYADALARVLGIGRHERRYISWVMTRARLNRSGGLEQGILEDGLLNLSALKQDVLGGDPVAYASWTVWERWDGRSPSGLSAERVPLLARVIAVAEHWSELTAQGGPELAHEQALAELRAEAGHRYDPRVIDAVEFIVSRERRVTSQPAFAPRLHRVPRQLGLGSFSPTRA